MAKAEKEQRKQSQAFRKFEEDWKMDLENLFDIAHANALIMIKIKEDNNVLLAQRRKNKT